MKKFLIAGLLLFSLGSFAGVSCEGGGIRITISNSLHATIMRNGAVIAETSDVSDISAFDLHYIGNFGHSSFDLVVQSSGKAILQFDNYSLNRVKLYCH